MAVGSALGVVLRRNPIHSALFLVAHLATLAALFLKMRAEFLAAAQVIVYAGAIAVLFVFAIMVLIPGKEETGPDPLRSQRLLAVPVAGLLLVLLAVMLRSTLFKGAAPGGGRARRRGRDRPGALHGLPLPVRGHLGAAPCRPGRRDGAGQAQDGVA